MVLGFFFRHFPLTAESAGATVDSAAGDSVGGSICCRQKILCCATDANHYVTKAIDQKLLRLKENVGSESEWKTECICSCPEEVMRIFYDEDGNETRVNDQKDHHMNESMHLFWIQATARAVRLVCKPCPSCPRRSADPLGARLKHSGRWAK